MRLGIDLGTTRTIVAVADRGNFPLIGFATPEGDVAEHVPTISAEVDGALVHGHAAEQASVAGAPHLRSWKRLLSRHAPDHVVRIGRVEVTLVELVTDFLAALKEALKHSSNLPRRLPREPDVVVSVPANAHSGQRFITLDGYRRAGFRVISMLNEPSAAGIEFAHGHRGALNARRDHVTVYDLGGGTFDAALVLMADDHHDVIDTVGIHELGGDDFDRALLDLALEAYPAGATAAGDHQAELLLECRHAKEAIGPNSRRIVLELAALGDAAPGEPLVLGVDAFYERVAPLVTRTIEATALVMSPTGESAAEALKERAREAGVAGIYVVGGASALPIVPRMLRAELGRRVHRSTYPAGSIAIGLAIAAASGEEPALRERLSRHLGVFREAENGRRIVFDRIFARGTPMPNPGGAPLVATRTYRAAHNVGFFRFVECAAIDRAGEPAGDITPHASVAFPFVPDLRNDTPSHIERLPDEGPPIEERYEVDAAGVVKVTIRDLRDGFAREYVL